MSHIEPATDGSMPSSNEQGGACDSSACRRCNWSVRLASVATVGLVIGTTTSFLQGLGPSSLNFLTNSGAVWTLIAFVLVLPITTRARMAVAAGAVGLLTEVLGYYFIACPMRQIAEPPNDTLLWVVAALVMGPFAGWLAYNARQTAPVRRNAAVAAAAGVLAGEGVYALLCLHYPVQGSLEVGFALVMIIISAMLSVSSWRSVAVGSVVAVLTATPVYIAYAAI